jgi:hypothetical protein
MPWAAHLFPKRFPLSAHHAMPVPAIDRLPDETLLAIFLLLVPTTQRGSSSEPCAYVRPNRCWLAFSQTCQRWRTLALASPALWTTPPFNMKYQELALAMIARSGALPLDVIFSPAEEADWPVDRPEWAAVLANAPRVRELSLSAAREPFEALLASLRPLPALQRWRLSFTPDVDEERHIFFEQSTEEEEMGTPIWLEADAFAHVLPLTSLTHMAFNNCIPRPDAPIYAHLTALTITLEMFCDAAEPPEWEEEEEKEEALAIPDVMRMLAQCPLLEYRGPATAGSRPLSGHSVIPRHL